MEVHHLASLRCLVGFHLDPGSIFVAPVRTSFYRRGNRINMPFILQKMMIFDLSAASLQLCKALRLRLEWCWLCVTLMKLQSCLGTENIFHGAMSWTKATLRHRSCWSGSIFWQNHNRRHWCAIIGPCPTNLSAGVFFFHLVAWSRCTTYWKNASVAINFVLFQIQKQLLSRQWIMW